MPRIESDFTFLTVTSDPRQYWIGYRLPIGGPEGHPGYPGILLFATDSIFNRKLFPDVRSLIWLAAGMAAIALVCWLPFVHGVTGSIQGMAQATGEIAQGRFDHPVPKRRSDELGHLGEQINVMAARLERFVKDQKRFLGDIAHELSAPIARTQFAIGILERKVEQPQAPYVATLGEEIQEMSALVNELLMFSKAGMQPSETPLEPVDLTSVVAQAVRHQRDDSGMIHVDIQSGLAVAASEPYLRRAISNLLRNAIRYAGDGGPITVAARRQGGQVVLTVADSGPGLPESALEEVFEPFYRPEASRSRDTGGAGLGLAIVKSCIEACRGTVACRNRQPSGLEVVISLAAA